MTTFPRSPRLLRGAIIADPLSPFAKVIAFQYNPETMSRSLEAQIGADGGSPAEARRLKGAPVETISLEIAIDATDQLEEANPRATSMGIHPQLAALEMLLYPLSARVIANALLSALGTIEIMPPEAPLTLFVWGPRRVQPINLTSYSVTEEAFDVNLNPIRARVSLAMRVLTYDDLPFTDAGAAIFLANQVLRETMATLGGGVDTLFDVASGDTRLF